MTSEELDFDTEDYSIYKCCYICICPRGLTILLVILLIFY